MCEWISIKIESPPLHEKCLAYWSGSKHIEDVTFFWDGGLCCALFDGEILNDFPSHWMLPPKDPD